MIQDFLDYKHSLGFKYATGVRYLHELDRFYEWGGYPAVFSRELIESWILLKEGAAPSPYRSWISPIRELGKYLQLTGCPDAYIVSGRFVIKKYRPTPYFFTEDEISSFFAACDHVVLGKRHQGRHLAIPVFFRFLYCCGVRTCEARLLLRENVNLVHGHADIIHSKGFKSRRIFLPEDLNSLFLKYDREMSAFFPDREYFFPSTTGGCYSQGAAGRNFNLIWDAAGLRKKYGKQPRAYDFRHHFAFANVNRWAKGGLNVNAMLPYLMRYMGHSTLESTCYYIHLVPEFFSTYLEKTHPLEDLLPEAVYEE
jgi:integrase